MATKKKLLQAAAGQAGGAGENIEDLFSNYVYTGTGSNRYVYNGLDLSTEGGMVWIKARSTIHNHVLYDTERLAYRKLSPNQTNAESIDIGGLMEFTTNGFRVGTETEHNQNNTDFISWSWRKAENFFDVVTYTGDGTSGRTVSHNLGSVPGMMIVKSRSTADQWIIYHRDVGNTKYLRFGTNAAATASSVWNNTSPTSTEFTLGNAGTVNQNGSNYVAYLFAHHDGDGTFGPSGDADVVSCGSYTGSGSAGKEVTLGWEPQWLLIKKTNATRDWIMLNNISGMFSDASSTGVPHLHANNGNSESSVFQVYPTATGFVLNTGSSDVNGTSDTYAYMAIRRGPMAVPESATDVFDVGDASETGSTAPEYEGGFTVDMALKRIQSASQSNYIFDRLRGSRSIIINGTAAESAFGAAKFDYMDGYYNGTSSSSTNWSAMWKRAPNFFDVVAYTGSGNNTNVKHNLGVTPELCIAKARTTTGIVDDWYVWCSHSGDGNNTVGVLNGSGTDNYGFHWASPTSTDLYLHTNAAYSGTNYIAYLFATLAGVSKVGSYTGSASAQTIDCGFTAGARFVLIKRTDSTGSWVVWDTNRGIVAGNDPYFKLETNAAPETADDIIDPHNSGFTLAGGVGFANTSGGSYIFYAVA